MTDLGSTSPTRTALSPAPKSIPRLLEMLGRRRSASTSRTRLPSCASTIAELMLVVVLPSSGSGLVNKINWGGVSGIERRIEVRRARYDSAIAEFGREYARAAISSLFCGSEH